MLTIWVGSQSDVLQRSVGRAGGLPVSMVKVLVEPPAVAMTDGGTICMMSL